VLQLRVVGMEERVAECIGGQPSEHIHLINASSRHMGRTASFDSLGASFPELSCSPPQLDDQPVGGL